MPALASCGRAVRQRSVAVADKVLSPNLRLAGALLSGATVVAHVCSKVPKKAEQVPAASLGTGVFNANGGAFTVKTPGRAVCLAVVWEGSVVVTHPDLLPMDVREGDKAKCGPLEFASRQ